MRFRFCGDLDAPDWLLAEIFMLSKIPTEEVKVMLKEVIQYILEGNIDLHNVTKATSGSLEGGLSDTKGAISCLHFCLVSSAKYDVEDSTLLVETQQLGLPAPSAEALTAAFANARERLRETLMKRSYQVNRLQSVEWRVDHVIASSQRREQAEPTGPRRELHMKFVVDNSTPVGASSERGAACEELAMLMTEDKFQVLQFELRKAKAQMAALNS